MCAWCSVPVHPVWRADQDTLTVHDMVDIAHQITQHQLLRTAGKEELAMSSGACLALTQQTHMSGKQ